MNLKKEYYKLNQTEFKNLVETVKNNPSTKHFLDGYFYSRDESIMTLLIEIHKLQVKFDSLIESFSPFGISQLLQSFLLKEIEATNKIENIYSTRHDIYSVMHQIKDSHNKKLVSIVNSYKALLSKEFSKIDNPEDIRLIYDKVLDSCIDKENKPDGKIFRKGPVSISNGIEDVHKGALGEDKIIKLMNDYLSIYNSNGEIYEKMAISHFIFEYIHPFYDGNGRLGRFLFSNALLKEGDTWFSFLISYALSKHKTKYYKALEAGSDIHQFGCINTCVEGLLKILIDELNDQIDSLKDKQSQIRGVVPYDGLSKSEKIIYRFLKEASILSDFGASNEEILSNLKVSKRTLMYTLEKFRGLGIIEDTKFGKIAYHRIA